MNRSIQNQFSHYADSTLRITFHCNSTIFLSILKMASNWNIMCIPHLRSHCLFFPYECLTSIAQVSLMNNVSVGVNQSCYSNCSSVIESTTAKFFKCSITGHVRDTDENFIISNFMMDTLVIHLLKKLLQLGFESQKWSSRTSLTSNCPMVT